MNIRFEAIGPGDAQINKEFIFPWVVNSKDFEDYFFYAAIADDKLAGILVADPRVYEPEILSIGISKEFEGQGIGTALLEYAIYDMLENYDEEVDKENTFIAQVYGEPERIKAVKKVFENNGFNAYEEGMFYETAVSKLKDHPHIQTPSVLKRLCSEEGLEAFRSLKNTDKKLINAFGNYLVENEIFSGINIDELDEDITFFGIKDGEIAACILFAKESGGIVQNCFLFNREESTSSSKNLLYLFSASAKAIQEKFPEDTKLNFYIGNKNTKGLVEKLFPDAKPKEAAIRFELPFANLFTDSDNRFTDDIEFNPIDNESLVCKNCKYCTASIISCEKYLQKPDAVLDGEECKLFSSK